MATMLESTKTKSTNCSH